MSEEINSIIKDTNRTDLYYKILSPVLDQVVNFVKSRTVGRDDTHGYTHMNKIANLASYLAEKENLSSMAAFDCIVVAYLHDVADHKYDKNGELYAELQEFLQVLFPLKWQFYLDVIERISYSKEVKNGTTDWKEIIGDYGIKVRNIVSDADKLDAIGNDGLERCYQYAIAHGHTPDDARKHVKQHADEKLLKLTANFIRTDSAKALAIKLHEEMQKTLLKY
jgi:HD superfamily phosphodiesterase